MYFRNEQKGGQREKRTGLSKCKVTDVSERLCWYQFVVLQLFGVDTLWVVDGSIYLTNAHTLGPKPVQVPHGVKTHITKALWKTSQGYKHYRLTSWYILLKSIKNTNSKHY